MDEVMEPEFVSRVAALDLGKVSLVACVRVPHPDRPGRRYQQVRTFDAMRPSLLALADWLRCERVSRVAMEATGDYWKPVFYLLEEQGFECWLLNARHVKNVPGRPKTDRLDAVWLAKVTERGMCSPSLVHPKPIRQLRDLTRYRRTLVRERAREAQRLEKLLEDAQIKLSSVIEDILGRSGRDMIEALIAGQRDPKVLARMARTRMRAKIPVLTEALTGHFEDHHAFVARQMLDRIDDLEARVETLCVRIGELIAPFREHLERLDEVPGIGLRSAEELIAEIGVDMSRFATAGHLVSWARFAPMSRDSGSRSGRRTTGKGNPWLAATIGEIVIGYSRTATFLGDQYRRRSRRIGKLRALVAGGNSVLEIYWHLMSDTPSRFKELGVDYYQSRIDPRRRQQALIRELEHLTGQQVTLTPAA